MSNFLLQKTDIVPIKKTSSGGPVDVSVNDIITYGKNNNYGNSFVLYDCGNSRAGLGIRYFNVTTDTIYLATTTFLSDTNSYIGVGIYDNRYIQSPKRTLFGSTGSSISALGVSTNFLSQTVQGIQYGKNGGNLSGYGSQQAFYIDESVATIYIDNVPYKKTGTVQVNYYLPDYEYTYAKITYKQDSEPASETDGTSVNILKDETSVNIEGLEEEKTYYFKIFTDKSESEAFPFLVPELIDYGNMIFNDNSEITAARSSYTASTTPKFLVDMYKEKSTQSGYAYMNPSANTWLIGPANNANGYSAIFGWTLPTNKDIYIICQNDTGQNAYYVWIWWDGFTSRDMLGTNCGYYKEINVQSNGTISQYQASTAINCYSGFSNSLTINSNRYWSQTWLGGSETLKPIVWTEVSTSRIWVNGQKLT